MIQVLGNGSVTNVGLPTAAFHPNVVVRTLPPNCVPVNSAELPFLTVELACRLLLKIYL